MIVLYLFALVDFNYKYKFKAHFLKISVFSYTETKLSTSAALNSFIPIDIQKVFTEEVAYIQFASFYTIFIPKIVFSGRFIE